MSGSDATGQKAVIAQWRAMIQQIGGAGEGSKISNVAIRSRAVNTKPLIASQMAKRQHDSVLTGGSSVIQRNQPLTMQIMLPLTISKSMTTAETSLIRWLFSKLDEAVSRYRTEAVF